MIDDLFCIPVFAVIVIILLIYASYVCGYKKCEIGMMHGFWQTSAEFNKEAGLQLFTVYIGNCKNGSYPAYLLMVESDDDQTVLINEPVNFTLKETVVCKLKQTTHREFVIRFDSLESELLPQTMQLKFYPQTGKIIMMDNKKVYAALFKNAILSEMERIKEEKNKSNNTPTS
jgi:hypothetical protein